MSAHAELRLLVLLSWAVEFVERNTDALEECSTNASGEYDDDSTAEEDVADARRWLSEARELLDARYEPDAPSPPEIHDCVIDVPR
jgi:hypothetical protein